MWLPHALRVGRRVLKVERALLNMEREIDELGCSAGLGYFCRWAGNASTFLNLEVFFHHTKP